jgi:hypothetical protein
MLRPIALMIAVILSTVLSAAPRAWGAEDLTALSIAALSDDKAQAARAIAALRAQGPAGLEALVGTYRSAIDRHRQNPNKPEAMWDRLAAALDGVAAQKDAWAAELYWYTDLNEAQRVATASGRPILSLRLLGTLDSEFSCANSRFFRTVLYPNAQVGRALREGFVLHWQSHRPVPKLTIDFGDGRKIERTITGNSVHYVLTPDGRVADVIPGLYGPAPFLAAVERARTIAAAYERPEFASLLAEYHRVQRAAVAQAWATDLRAVGAPMSPAGKLAAAGELQPPALAGAKGAPPALAAARIAVGKGDVERRPLMAMTTDRATLAASTDDAVWAKIAALHAADGRLDAGSRAVMLSKVDAVAANNLTAGKKRVEDPVMRLVRNFERAVAEDTVRNEYGFHTQIHEWFVTNQVPANLDELNERVYAELFLMPRSDPWLGLVPADAYTALPGTAGR